MNGDLFRGDLVQLVKEEPEIAAKAFARWERDSEYMRLMDDEPVHMRSQKLYEQKMGELEGKMKESFFLFHVKTLSEDRLIGFVNLFLESKFHREAWVGIGLGEKESWGKGYGTDAMRLALRYAFQELNMFRVSLDVFEYNSRAFRSYQKAGFILEGRSRQSICRDGKRHDLLFMGILRDEWLAQNTFTGQRID
jgi:RimJ/RimL family protein N-acetyltransferase